MTQLTYSWLTTRTRPNTNNTNPTHQADGLPLVYEPEVIKKYWDKRPSEMQRRWALFLSVTAPFITKLVRRFTSGTIFQVLFFCFFLEREKGVGGGGGVGLGAANPTHTASH